MAAADEGTRLVQEANKKLKSGGGFLNSLVGGGNKHEAALELFKQAANQFKLAQLPHEAASALQQASVCAGQVGADSERLTLVVDAANQLKKVSPVDAEPLFLEAVEAYNKSGRFAHSARLLRGLAEECDSSGDHAQAVVYYRKASDLFGLEEFSRNDQGKCDERLAELTADQGDLPGAIELFEKEGRRQVGSKGLSFGAREMYFKAMLLVLATGDDVTIKLKLDEYMTQDPRLYDSMEGELLRNLAAAFEQLNKQAFVDALGEYDRIKRLEPWKTRFLLRAKQLLEAASGDGGAGGGGGGAGGGGASGAAPDLTGAGAPAPDAMMGNLDLT